MKLVVKLEFENVNEAKEVLNKLVDENSGLICDSCMKEVSAKVADFSAKEFGRILCFECQKQARNKS